MLATDNIIVSDYLIANTAILGGNSNATKQLKFTEKLNDMLLILEKSKKEMLFGETITKLFFPNNEVFFHYLLDKNKIKWFNIPYEWHTYNKIDKSKAKLIHVINKKFEELWELI